MTSCEQRVLSSPLYTSSILHHRGLERNRRRSSAAGLLALRFCSGRSTCAAVSRLALWKGVREQ